jgi:microcystin degradation protein MlrC
MDKIRIAIGQVWQEQNTFSPLKTFLSNFKDNGLYYGGKIIEKLTGINEIGGFIGAADEEKESNIELIPTIRAFAWPSGNITGNTFIKIKNSLINLLKKSRPLDGILLSFHGSMVAENVPDTEGDLLESISKEFKGIPVAISLDLHANITEKMLKNATYIEGYHTCPHKDLFSTGYKAGKILILLLKNKLNIKAGYVKLPMITPARLHNTGSGPFKKLFDFVHKIEEMPDVIGASLFPVQPWLDVPELGWSVIVYADSNEEKAQNYAEEIADMAWSLRNEFFIKETPPSEALKEADNMKDGLMVISDSDSTTSGGTGDNICILAEMLRQKIKFPALLTLVDKEVVKKAIDAGKGKKLVIKIGGKMDRVYSQSVTANVEVVRITESKFVIDGHVGKNYIDMGRAVILKTGSISILVTEKIGPVYEQNVYKNAGLDPKDFRVVVVKSPVGFRDAYEPIAKRIVLADCPGLSSSNLKRFTYNNISRPLFPFDEIDNWRK